MMLFLEGFILREKTEKNKTSLPPPPSCKGFTGFFSSRSRSSFSGISSTTSSSALGSWAMKEPPLLKVVGCSTLLMVPLALMWCFGVFWGLGIGFWELVLVLSGLGSSFEWFGSFEWLVWVWEKERSVLLWHKE